MNFSFYVFSSCVERPVRCHSTFLPQGGGDVPDKPLTRTYASCVIASLATYPQAPPLGVARTRADVMIDVQTRESCRTFVSPLELTCRLSEEAAVSEIAMKEMETVSLGPLKVEGRPDDVSSFLLVDEQENLQVKLANVN